MPLVFVKIIENALERLVINLDFFAVTLWPFQFVNVEQTAIQIGDVAEQLFQVRRTILAAFTKAFVKQPEQKIAVERVKLVLALFLLAAGKTVAKIFRIAVQETFALDE